MSRETECKNRIDYLTKTFHATPNEVICDILCDIAISIAQIADRLNPVVTVNDKTVIHTYDSTNGYIGGRGGE